MARMTKLDRAAICARDIWFPLHTLVWDYAPHFTSTLLAIRVLPETTEVER